MVSNSLLLVSIALIFSLGYAAPSTQTTFTNRKRFIFAAAQDGSPVTVVSGSGKTSKPTSKPTSSPSRSPTVTKKSESEPEPKLHPTYKETSETKKEYVPHIAYNIGGKAYGMWAADPTKSVVGETAIFNIEDAVIAGADPGNGYIYKSHRYGLFGSTWGYDIVVNTAGIYDCNLHYAETFSEFFDAEPNRTFTVQISGDGDYNAIQSEKFDVMVELNGSEFSAYTRNFKNIPAVTKIKIRESPSTGDAFLSGIFCNYVSPLAMA